MKDGTKLNAKCQSWRNKNRDPKKPTGKLHFYLQKDRKTNIWSKKGKTCIYYKSNIFL